MTDRELIQRHIERHPHHPGPAHARLIDDGTDVWLIVAFAKCVGWNFDQVATTYGIPLASVQAVCDYHARHQELIDARIALEHAAFS